jgi:hypothetical protein
MMRENYVLEALAIIRNGRVEGLSDSQILSKLRDQYASTEAEIAEAFRRANAPTFYQAPAPKIPTWVWVVGGVSLAFFLLSD